MIDDITERAKHVLRIEAEAVHALENRIDENFRKAVEILYNSTGKVIVTGIGKSGIIGKKIASTFTSLGKASYFLHPVEGAHGDVGMVLKNDVIICISKSGNTHELAQIMPVFKRIGVPIISITGNIHSELAEKSTVVLDVSVQEEACPFDMVPTASTTATLAMGDALAVALIQLRNFSLEDYATLHPGGAIGKKLTQLIDDVMFSGDRLAIVKADSTLKDVVYEISSKRFGATCVVNDKNELIGIVTDGDLRRLLEKKQAFSKFRAKDLMTPDPIVVKTGTMATDVVNIMKIHAINQIVIVDLDKKPIGMVHLHDLLKASIT